MSLSYQAVQWNRQKKVYDAILGAGVLLYMVLFAGVGARLHPNATAETLLIRALGTLAFLMLHVILAIGPLCRLDPRFLPLLYNRRHLGVTMFGIALASSRLGGIQTLERQEPPRWDHPRKLGQGGRLARGRGGASGAERRNQGSDP